MSNTRALRERIRFMEREMNKKDHVASGMQAYIHDLENKMWNMNSAISRLQQEVSDFQFEKLQLNNQIVEKDNQLTMIMTMNPHMMNLQGFTDTVYYDCPDQVSEEPGPQQVVESVETPSNASLNDIRDRYDDLLVEFPENDANEEVNWTLTMISKIVDYYETIGKSVYEEIAPNKYISTLILADKSDPIPNKFEGTVAVGNGDTPLEATQCAVQWAYGYIQSCIANDSNGNGVLRSDPETVPSSPRLPDNLNEKTTGMNADGSEDSSGIPENIVRNGFYSSTGSCKSRLPKIYGEGHQKSATFSDDTYADTKPRDKDSLVVSSDPDENQNGFEAGVVNAEIFCEDLNGIEEMLVALNSIAMSSPAEIDKIE